MKLARFEFILTAIGLTPSAVSWFYPTGWFWVCLQKSGVCFKRQAVPWMYSEGKMCLFLCIWDPAPCWYYSYA